MLKVNDIQIIACKLILKLDYKTCPDINTENQPCCSQVLEIRITFINSQRNMTYGYCLKQPMSMCEIRLYQLLYKNPQLINNPNRFNFYPNKFIRICQHFS